jgi:hypothetical protein
MIYGEVTDGEHDFIHLGDQNMEVLSGAMGGFWLVDWFPARTFTHTLFVILMRMPVQFSIFRPGCLGHRLSNKPPCGSSKPWSP